MIHIVPAKEFGLEAAVKFLSNNNMASYYLNQRTLETFRFAVEGKTDKIVASGGVIKHDTGDVELRGFVITPEYKTKFEPFFKLGGTLIYDISKNHFNARWVHANTSNPSFVNILKKGGFRLDDDVSYSTYCHNCLTLEKRDPRCYDHKDNQCLVTSAHLDI